MQPRNVSPPVRRHRLSPELPRQSLQSVARAGRPRRANRDRVQLLYGRDSRARRKAFVRTASFEARRRTYAARRGGLADCSHVVPGGHLQRRRHAEAARVRSRRTVIRYIAMALFSSFAVAADTRTETAP